MWKIGGVVALWIVLIAAPHLGGPMTQVSLAGVLPTPAVPMDDPGDPYLEARRPSERHEIPGAFATVHFTNALDKTLGLNGVTVTMDGQPLPAVTNLRAGADTVVFAGRISPGAHAVVTDVTCRGRRRGPFTYLSDYKWQVHSEETLTVPAERAVSFTISPVRRKGMNVPLMRQVEITVRSELVPQKVSVRD
jgi:hypothetical protein